MARFLYGESVKGASHVRNGMPCQDSFKIDEFPGVLSIIAVADGHGSEKSPRSKSGSQIAVNVFSKVMQDYLKNYATTTDELITYLNRDGQVHFAQDICMEWQRRVRKSFNDSKGEKPLTEDGQTDWRTVYQMYGTTLLGLLITMNFIFAFQIGDGDIRLIDGEKISPVVESEKILGVETHSLSNTEAWKKAVTSVRRREASGGRPYLYMLSTDGFANSYVSDDEFDKTGREYFDMIRQHGFDTVSSNLGKWLSETSELGCGDDITVVMAYFPEENQDEGREILSKDNQRRTGSEDFTL